MPVSRKYLEGRADRLFAQWDAVEDPYSLPTREFQKLIAKVNEASTICMTLAACDAEKDKRGSKQSVSTSKTAY